MSSERSIETTGESVEEAISKGLAELGGVSPTDVIVEVLEEPSRGMFGLGARPARVRLQLFRTAAASTPVPTPTAEVEEVDAEPSAKASQPSDESFSAEVDEDEGVSLLEEMQEITDESLMDEDVRVAKVVLGELLERMQILRPEIIVRRAVNSREGEGDPWLLDITGPNLNSLIGRRGETLNALQYITRLISSRELQHRANIVVDAAGYKAKRSRMLHDLALRMADQASRTKRTVALEPMPPYERRIVHMALRSRNDVQTKSVGEGNSRKVTIVPR
ncbi:MAG: Jag N-terminal domain-containing protein [Chloroflexi bacterium]|nr:Jag N-terminal domain-containing protein [Chloroflexota bacterium]MCC6895601.1 Jag N-terminal domain-containing protein [Anaerolineae bacterium]